MPPRSAPAPESEHRITAYKARHVTSGSCSMQNLEQYRKWHRDNAAKGRTRVCEPRLFFAKYAPKHKLLTPEQHQALMRTLDDARAFHRRTKEWSALPMPRKKLADDDASKEKESENNHFKSLETVVDQILSAAEKSCPRRYSLEKRTTEFVCRPDRITYSETSGSSQRMDCIFVRLQTSYPPGIRLDKRKEVSLLGESRIICTADLTSGGEAKMDDKPKNKLDNQKKVIGHQAHIFQNDVGRVAVFTFTIEGHKLRIWYHTRSHSAVTEPIDIYKNKKWFIEFILFMTYAPLSELGIDPSVRRVLDTKGNLQYQFDIYPPRTSRPPVTYETIRLLDESSAYDVYSRAMRVYEVYLVIKNSDDPKQRILAKESNVLRDYWTYDDVRYEHEIQKDIIGRIKKIPTIAKKALKHFMTIKQDGIVRHPALKGKDSSKVPAPPDDAEPFVFEVEDNPSGAGPSTPQVEASKSVRSTKALEGNVPAAPKVDAVPLLQLHAKKHCRTVYQQLCKDLYQIENPALFFHALAEVIRILNYFKQIGYVHRDVSPGNFLLYHASDGLLPELPSKVTRAVLDEWTTIVSDLEYARPYDESSGHDPITGTSYYTAVEVQSREYRFPTASAEKIVRIGAEAGLVVTGKRQGQNPFNDFGFNFYHDVESVMWMAIDFATRKMPRSILCGDAAHADQVAVQLRSYAAQLFTDEKEGSRIRDSYVTNPLKTNKMFDNFKAIYGTSPISNVIALMQDMREAYTELEKSTAPTTKVNKNCFIFHPHLFQDAIYESFEATFRQISDHYLAHPETFAPVPPPPPPPKKSTPPPTPTPISRKPKKGKARAAPVQPRIDEDVDMEATSETLVDSDEEDEEAAPAPGAEEQDSRGRKRAAPKDKGQRSSKKRCSRDEASGSSAERSDGTAGPRRSARLRNRQSKPQQKTTSRPR